MKHLCIKLASLWARVTMWFMWILCRNAAYCVKLSDGDLSCCSNKIESVGLRKCPFYHYLAKKVMPQ